MKERLKRVWHVVEWVLGVGFTVATIFYTYREFFAEKAVAAIAFELPTEAHVRYVELAMRLVTQERDGISRCTVTQSGGRDRWRCPGVTQDTFKWPWEDSERVTVRIRFNEPDRCRARGWRVQSSDPRIQIQETAPIHWRRWEPALPADGCRYGWTVRLSGI